MKAMAAAEFKAKCLAVLDEVQRTGQRVTITKRGRPVAEVAPVSTATTVDPLDGLRGRGEIVGDIVAPIGSWSVVEPSPARRR